MKSKRWMIFLLMIVMACAAVTGVQAEADAADKTVSSPESNSRKHRVTVTVPGADKENRHDEILIMVDGSYSLDNEWPYAKAGVLEIAGMVLNGKNNVSITLMAFGMGPNVVAEHISTMEELEKLLDTYQGNLLYGRSSTNIEGAFIGIQRYLAEHDDTLRDATVIFMTDGGVNQNARPNRWLTENIFRYTRYNEIATLICDELAAVEAGAAVLSEGTRATFTEEEIEKLKTAGSTNDTAAMTAIVSAAYDETMTKGTKWLQNQFSRIYAYHGMSDEDGGYSVCDMERATLDYQKANGLWMENAFYYTAARAGSISDSTDQQRAVDAAWELVTNEEYHLKNLYLVRYANDSRAGWMQFKNGSTQYKEMPENVEYIHSSKISDLAETIREMMVALSLTPFNNVSIVDYMSKWVELQPETICVLDKDDQLVAAYDPENSDPANNVYRYKWLTEEPLCQDLPPIVVSDVPGSEYEMGGPDVVGNASGGIKKITWNIKQGPLLKVDHYRMEYDILVDVNEPGFRYSVFYPTNGITYVHYTDENDEPQTNEIPVPNVKFSVPRPAVTPAPQPTPPPADVPQTGDSMQPAFWLAALLITGTALGLSLRRKRRG